MIDFTEPKRKYYDLSKWSITTSLILGYAIAFCLSWTYTYDIATPVGTDAPSVLDDRDRETKAAVQERINVDHFFPLTGTQVSDAAAGQHRQIEFYAPITTPSSAANKMWIYGKDVGGKIELHVLDEDGNERQFTDAGSFNMALLTSQTITTPTLTSPVINTSVSGTAVLDEDAMGSDSDTQIATQQSIKAYVDDNIGSANYTPTGYAGGESVTFPNGLILKHGFKSRAGTETTVTFAVAFPTSCKSVTATQYNTVATGETGDIQIEAVSKTSFRVVQAEATMEGFYWQALGY